MQLPIGWVLQSKLLMKIIHEELTAEISRRYQKEAWQDRFINEFFIYLFTSSVLRYHRAPLHSVAKLALLLVTWTQTVFVFTAEEKRPYPAAQQGNSVSGREGKAKVKAPCACWPPPPSTSPLVHPRRSGTICPFVSRKEIGRKVLGIS